MTRYLFLTIVLSAGLLASGCGKSHHHKGDMPDPKTFQGHFGDMDASGDDRVNYEEFKAYFPHAEPQVFQAIDLDGGHPGVLENREGILVDPVDLFGRHDPEFGFQIGHGCILPTTNNQQPITNNQTRQGFSLKSCQHHHGTG